MGQKPPNRAKTSFRWNPDDLSVSSQSSDVLPCARRESAHMGACQLVLTDARESQNHEENCTRPSEAPPLPCATLPRSPFRTRPRTASPARRSPRTDLEAEYDRSRRSGAALPRLAAGSQLARSRFAAGPQPAHNPGRPSWSTPRSGRRTPSRRSSRVLRSVPAA